MYSPEAIPDADDLFLRVHRGHIKEGQPIHRAFQEWGGGLSTNWAKYASAEETRDQVSRLFKPDKVTPKSPADYGVLSLVAGEVRQIESTTVEHTPVDENRAHTDIHGPGSPEEANTEV